MHLSGARSWTLAGFFMFWQRWMQFYNELFKIFPNKLSNKRISPLSEMRYLDDSWWVQPFLIRAGYIFFWAALHSFARNPGNIWIKLGPNSARLKCGYHHVMHEAKTQAESTPSRMFPSILWVWEGACSHLAFINGVSKFDRHEEEV